MRDCDDLKKIAQNFVVCPTTTTYRESMTSGKRAHPTEMGYCMQVKVKGENRETVVYSVIKGNFC